MATTKRLYIRNELFKRLLKEYQGNTLLKDSDKVIEAMSTLIDERDALKEKECIQFSELAYKRVDTLMAMDKSLTKDQIVEEAIQMYVDSKKDDMIAKLREL